MLFRSNTENAAAFPDSLPAVDEAEAEGPADDEATPIPAAIAADAEAPEMVVPITAEQPSESSLGEAATDPAEEAVTPDAQTEEAVEE